jgi:DNA-binding protein
LLFLKNVLVLDLYGAYKFELIIVKELNIYRSTFFLTHAKLMTALLAEPCQTPAKLTHQKWRETQMPEKKTRERKVKEEPTERPAEAPVPAQRQRSPENVIFVGQKDTMNYVLATVLQFSKGSSEVSIKARGRLISKAVDVAEITRARFLQNKCKVKAIEIDTEEIKEEDRKRNVSTISIVLEKA